MGSHAKVGTYLGEVVKMAMPLCQQAERHCPRTGPGAKPEYPDWMMAMLIMVAVLKRKKSKSAQYRFLSMNRRELANWLGRDDFPARSTYFGRYQHAHRLFDCAIRLQGQRAIKEGVAQPKVVAVDKSLLAARGPQWHHRDRKAGRIPKGLHGVDRDSTWSYSKHDGWVQGYSVEVVVSATRKSVVFPLLASAATAEVSEHQSFDAKIEHLPEAVSSVVADAGYDNNQYGERIEYDDQGKRTGRRFVCPENRRNTKRRAKQKWPRSAAIQRSQARRRQRRKFYRSPRGRRLYARRGRTVEPFHEWFKSLFELETHVWHRGLSNNQTQLLAAIFAYQLLVRYNCKRGNKNGQIRHLLDAL